MLGASCIIIASFHTLPTDKGTKVLPTKQRKHILYYSIYPNHSNRCFSEQCRVCVSLPKNIWFKISSHESSEREDRRLQPEEVAATVEEALAALELNDATKVEEEEEDIPLLVALEPTPLPPPDHTEQDGGDELVPVFSDDELVAALLGIEDENIQVIDYGDDFLLDPLPDIDIYFGDTNDNDDDIDFIDPDHLGSIFDDFAESQPPQHEEQEEEEESEETTNVLEETSKQDSKADSNTVNLNLDEATIDLDTEELYNDLAKLSLGPVEDPALYSEESTDGLPSYLFCQPCLAEGEDLYNQVLYPPIELDSDEDDDTALPPPQDDFLQDLMKLSSLQLEDDPDFQLHDMNPPDYQDDTPQHHHQQPAPPTSTPVRQEAWDAAAGMLEAFGVTEGSESKEKSCLGHKETIFGVTFSECGNFCATASQDSTVDVWDVEKNSLLASLKDHSKDYECLRVAWASSSWATSVLDRTSNFRYLLASSGADGTVRLWACRDPRIEQGQEGCWKSYVTMHHDFFPNESTPPPETEKKLETITEDGNEGEEKQPEEPDKPQVYALQFIDHWSAFNTSGQEKTNSFLMTSSDDYIHFWELDIRPASEQNISLENGTLDITSDEMSLKEVMSLHFGSLGHYGFGVNVCNVTGSGLQVPSTDTDTSSSSASASGTPFGGDRNPNNVIFVFDAAYCAENGLLGVALSDGSLRLINGRGICVSILNLPGCQSHLTSFSWDSTGTRLATSVATGHLITWQLDVGDVQGRGNTVATCTGIMEGGHQVGRPLFGSRYCGDDLLVSWSVDGSLCLWDSHSQGNVQSPMAILRQDENYPIYAVEVYKDSCIAVGGGSEGGFIGVPLYMYAYKSSPTVAKQSSLDGKVEATDQKLTASAIANDENATKQSEKTDKTSLPPSNQSLQQSNENSSTKLNVPKEDKDVTPLPAASKEDN